MNAHTRVEEDGTAIAGVGDGDAGREAGDGDGDGTWIGCIVPVEGKLEAGALECAAVARVVDEGWGGGDLGVRGYLSVYDKECDG